MLLSIDDMVQNAGNLDKFVLSYIAICTSIYVEVRLY